MVGSVVVNGLMGLAYTMVLLYSSSTTDLLGSPLNFPFIQIYLDATKSRAGTTAMAALVLYTAIAAATAGVMSTSRTLWAFARDRATPFDCQLSHVDAKLQVPVRAVVVAVVLQALLGFIYLGNTTAFSAILSMAIISMYLSYTLPIAYMLLYGRRRLARHEFGPFSLGPVVGVVFNLVSIAWMLVAIVFSTFPTTMPVTPTTMNYSSVVLAGWVLFGAVYYSLWGKHKFNMPMADGDASRGSTASLGSRPGDNDGKSP